MKIQTPKPTKDAYGNECFNIDFEEEKETRNWRTLPGFASIPDLAKGPDRHLALRPIDDALKGHPDHHFLYIWKGFVCEHYPIYPQTAGFAARHPRDYSPAAVEEAKQWISKARETYEEGLKVCRSKTSLLDQLGQWHHDYGDLRRAIAYWIKSCAVQSSASQFEYAHPFMMLEYVAWKLKMRGEEQALYRQKIRIDDIALDKEGEYQLGTKVERLRSEKKDIKSIKKAIHTLCKFYGVGK